MPKVYRTVAGASPPGTTVILHDCHFLILTYNYGILVPGVEWILAPLRLGWGDAVDSTEEKGDMATGLGVLLYQ